MSVQLADVVHSHWSSEKHHCILEKTLPSFKTEKTPFCYSGAPQIRMFLMNCYARQTALTNKLSFLFSVP